MDSNGYFCIIARKAAIWYPSKLHGLSLPATVKRSGPGTKPGISSSNSALRRAQSGSINIPAFPRVVEEVIYEIPQIKEVAVAGRPFAFLIVGPERPTQEAVIAYCKRRLPPYLVPRFVIFVDDFPRTFIGKVVRYQLKDLIKKRE